MRTIVHLLSSTVVGGPERQLLGLAQEMAADWRTAVLTFPERGRSRAFLRVAQQCKIEAQEIRADLPWLFPAIGEIATQLRQLGAEVLFCHGPKANLLGRLAARRVGIPVVAVSRGWTGEGLRARLGEAIDRFCLRWMDRVVCLSRAQADQVLRAGVRPERVLVVPNAVDPERYVDPDLRYRTRLARVFRQPRTRIIGTVGRLSPERGFDILIAAAEIVMQRAPRTGFVIFGEGPCRSALLRQINASGLAGDVVLTGFRTDLDRFVPFFDLLVLPSFTECLPNVVLEAFASGIPVVATAVGGAPELIEDGVNGYLVPPGDPQELADRICHAMQSEERLRDMGMHGRHKVLESFTFASQANQYAALIDQLLGIERSESRTAFLGRPDGLGSPSYQKEESPA
jgi:glycosyltransferase involved in cell wall biosynthesis